MKRLLYASPFPPKRSGISDYSSVLVKALSTKFDITLFTDDYEISDQSLASFPVLKYGIDDVDYSLFDFYIYNIGNNPEYHQYIYEAALKHPGMVILHDMILYYLFIGYYQARNSFYSSLYKKIGQADFIKIKDAVKTNGTALLEQKQMAAVLKLNQELISSGNKLMVHSEYTKNQILSLGLIKNEAIRHINLIEQIDENMRLIDREKLYKKYNIPCDALVIASFGYIAETKKNYEVCQAVKKMANELDRKICYLMVGAGDYVDIELEKNFIIKTGFTDLDEFDSFITYADIVVNLRFPSMGETSAAMLRILQMGKACITNNGGWFTELPDFCVYKIELDNIVDRLEKALKTLILNSEARIQLENNAKKYIQSEYNKEQIVNQIYDFLNA